MPVNLSEIHVGTAALGCPPGEARQMPGIAESLNLERKKAGTEMVPAFKLAGCPEKI
jgi:hypothetical protein